MRPVDSHSLQGRAGQRNLKKLSPASFVSSFITRVCKDLVRSPTCPHSAVEFCAFSAIGELVAPMAFISEIGALLPIAVCVQALRPQSAIERLKERIVRWLSRP